MDGNVTLVHNLETTPDGDTQPSFHTLKIAQCGPEWKSSVEMYQLCDDADGRNRVEQLESCRTRAWFVRYRLDNSVRVAANSCRLRWCPMCSDARRNYIQHQVSEWFPSADHPKLLTVTLKHSQDTLPNQINKLYQAFRKMRGTSFFRKHSTGGIWFFQICWNPKRHEWHPHLHAIVTGKYMDYKKLRKIWLDVTGDSTVLDIRIIRDPEKVGNDVARYAAKPCLLSNLPTEQGLQLITALHGRRLAGSWGTARGISFRPQKIADPENYEYLGQWSTIQSLAGNDPRADAILKAYHCGAELGAGCSCYDVENFIDDGPDLSDSDVTVEPRPPPELYS